MKNIEIAAAIAGCILLAGCGGAESEAKKSVLANLKDPDSAKFGKFTQVGENLACMTVNAKNSMGGLKWTPKSRQQFKLYASVKR